MSQTPKNSRRTQSARSARSTASAVVHATEGAAARRLDLVPASASTPGSARRLRTPLSVISSPARRRKAPLVIMSLLTLMAALAAVLVLNISVSSGQYELVSLRNQQSELDKTNQGLTQQDQNLQSPQNVASKAKDLGMVQAATPGQINAQTHQVAGNPTPAPAAGDPQPLIAGPDTYANGKGADTPKTADGQGKDESDQRAGNQLAAPGQKQPGSPEAAGADALPSPAQHAPGQ